MEQQTPATITDIRDAAFARWLLQTLEPVRDRLQETPSADAIERISARVTGDRKRAARTLAA